MTDDLNESDVCEDDPDFEFKDPSTKEKNEVYEIFTPEVCDALDRTKVSDGDACYIFAALPMIKNLNVILSKSTLRRRRINNRRKKLEQIKADFCPSVPLTVHWDGKMMPLPETREDIHRIVVNVTGENVDQLLFHTPQTERERQKLMRCMKK